MRSKNEGARRAPIETTRTRVFDRRRGASTFGAPLTLTTMIGREWRENDDEQRTQGGV